MSITSVNGHNSFVTRNAQGAALEYEKVLQREASGMRATNPGEFVSESAQANALTRTISSLRNARDILDQGIDMFRAAHSVVNSSFTIMNRVTDLSQRAMSPMVTERDRAAMQTEMDSLIKQLDTNSKTSYNGMTLLDGSFSGTKSLSTMQQQKILSYDINDVGQYVSYNQISDNPLLKAGSTVEAVTTMGRNVASADIELLGLAGLGISAAPADVKAAKIQEATDASTAALAASTAAAATAAADQTALATAQAGGVAATIAAAQATADASAAAATTATTAATAAAAALTALTTPPLAAAKSEIVINGEIFTGVDLVATNRTEADLSNHEFKLASTDIETIENLVKKLNASELSTVNQAYYQYVGGTKMTVTYSQAGSIGENFLVEVRIKDGDANNVYDLKNGSDTRDRAVLKVAFAGSADVLAAAGAASDAALLAAQAASTAAAATAAADQTALATAQAGGVAATIAAAQATADASAAAATIAADAVTAAQAAKDAGVTGPNYANGDKISLNGEIFKFVTEGSALLADEVEIGSDLAGTFENLFDKIRKSSGRANEATYEYNAKDAVMTITARDAGVKGNEFTVNFGVSVPGLTRNVFYSLAALQPATDPTQAEDLETSIASVANRSVLADGTVPLEGTVISKHEATFDQNMVGTLSNLSATFIAGDEMKNVAGATPTNNVKFNPNKVQFKVVMNGEVYQTNAIALAGGNKTGDKIDGSGYKGLGNRLAGGTELIFQKSGAKNTDAGFKLTVGEGFVIVNDDTIEGAQNELNQLVSVGGSQALEKSAVALGIAAPSKSLNDFSLDSIKKFSAQGFVPATSVLSGKVEITDQIGAIRAQGTISVVGNLAKGDFLYVNGTRLVIGDDVVLGANVKDMRDNILTTLNASHDSRIAQAFYTAGLGDGDITVSYGRTGTDGNHFQIGAKTSVANVINLNGNPVKDANQDVFRALGDDANKPNVIEGTNIANTTAQYTPTLQGTISNIKATFVEGSAPEKRGLTFTPNSVEFSAEIGGQIYVGTATLAGGQITPGDRPTPIGKNYNKLGDFLAGSIVLKSADSTHAVVLNVGEQGITLSGNSKSDIDRQLSEVASKIESDLSQITISQTRQITAFDESKTVDSSLSGLRKENVTIRGSDFDATGSIGNLSPFKFDAENNVISVSIDGVVYSQNLPDKEADGGLGNNYDSKNKVIKGGLNTTLLLATKDDKFDARQIMINLQGVTDIDLSSAERVRNFVSDLNEAFGVTQFAGGLTFQAGPSASDRLVFTLDNISSDSLLRDENGQRIEMNLSDRENLTKMFEIASEAADTLNVQRAQIGSIIVQLDNTINGVIDQLTPSLQNSVDGLINADMYETGAQLLKSSLKTSAGSAAFSHMVMMQRQLISTLSQSV